jgi:pimeloyl-ACP methyl ester carboxylesterase
MAMYKNLPYSPTRISRSEFIPVRHLNYHVRTWGVPVAGQAPLFMVHGWMDVGASFQFVVDALQRERWVIAPDWRGYGLTTGPATDNYWFPDYMADLDFLFDHYAGQAPVDLVGHSMGGHVATLYSGVRPDRVRRLVNLEGIGMAPTQAGEAPARYAQWMDELKSLHRGDLNLRDYDSLPQVAARLMKINPRLAPAKAQWLAQHWAQRGADGRWRLLGDAAHKVVNAQLFRNEEVLGAFQTITAPVLSVEGRESPLQTVRRHVLETYHERLKSVKNARTEVMPDAGHMLHHDQPEKLANLIESFLEAEALP